MTHRTKRRALGGLAALVLTQIDGSTKAPPPAFAEMMSLAQARVELKARALPRAQREMAAKVLEGWAREQCDREDVAEACIAAARVLRRCKPPR